MLPEIWRYSNHNHQYSTKLFLSTERLAQSIERKDIFSLENKKFNKCYSRAQVEGQR